MARIGSVACGTSQTVSTGESQASSLSLEVLKRSLDSAKDLKRFRARVNMDMTMLGQETPMSAAVEVPG